MLVKLKYLLRVLEIGSVDWLIDPVVVRFTEGNITMLNISEGYTILAYLNIQVGTKYLESVRVETEEGTKYAFTTPVVAGEYQPIGEIVFTSSIVKQLKKMFKGDEAVKLTVDNGNLIIEGASERFTIGKLILDKELPSIDFTQTDYGLLLSKPKLFGIYKIDITHLANLVYEDLVTFKFTKDGVTVATNVAGGRYEVKLRTHEIRQAPPSDYVQVFDGDYIETLAKVLDLDTVWLGVTEGPLHVWAKDLRYPYTATFVIAPRMG